MIYSIGISGDVLVATDCALSRNTSISGSTTEFASGVNSKLGPARRDVNCLRVRVHFCTSKSQ
jgi:hypothetical protein